MSFAIPKEPVKVTSKNARAETSMLEQKCLNLKCIETTLTVSSLEKRLTAQVSELGDQSLVLVHELGQRFRGQQVFLIKDMPLGRSFG